MTDSTNLALPYLEGAQAQKHVTVNESLRKLDALVLLAVEDKDLTAPPGSPADGARYIPKATASGLWSGKEKYIAHYVDGAWEFYAPREGFAAYVRDEDLIYLYNGSAWVTLDAALGPALITGRTEDTAPDPTGDYGLSYDASASALKKVRLDRIGGSGKHTDVSSTTTLDATQCGRTVRVDASGGAITITLPTSPSADDWVAVKKSDSSTNRVTVKVGSTDVAWLSAQNDAAMFAYWGGAWAAVWCGIAPIVNVFTGSGTWTKAPLAWALDIMAVGGGMGGGSGRRGAAGAARSGGGGGCGGVVTYLSMLAVNAGATETVTIGAGGAAGAAVTGNDTDGNAGGIGGTTSFGGHAAALNAGPGVGPGGAASATAASSNLYYGTFGVPGPGGQSSVAGASFGGTRGVTGGGGAGGSITTGNVAQAGGNGAAGSACATQTASASGGAADVAGSNGADVSNSVDYVGGGGGGGGGASTTGTGKAGGNGGAPGGGGGGGGAGVNGNNSGAGGAGGRGELRVWTYFG